MKIKGLATIATTTLTVNNAAPIVAAEIAVRLAILLFLLIVVERNRLLRLEHWLGKPFLTAFDASDGIVIAEVVKAFPAFGAGTLGAPFWLRHGKILEFACFAASICMRIVLGPELPGIKSRRALPEA